MYYVHCNKDLSNLPPVITEASEEGETKLAHVRHVREAESRGFHDEDVGRPAFGYEQFHHDVRIGGDGDGGALDEASSAPYIFCVMLRF